MKHSMATWCTQGNIRQSDSSLRSPPSSILFVNLSCKGPLARPLPHMHTRARVCALPVADNTSHVLWSICSRERLSRLRTSVLVVPYCVFACVCVLCVPRRHLQCKSAWPCNGRFGQVAKICKNNCFSPLGFCAFSTTILVAMLVLLAGSHVV